MRCQKCGSRLRQGTLTNISLPEAQKYFRYIRKPYRKAGRFADVIGETLTAAMTEETSEVARDIDGHDLEAIADEIGIDLRSIRRGGRLYFKAPEFPDLILWVEWSDTDELFVGDFAIA